MKVIVSPDSFKGSLSAIQVANAIERGAKKAQKVGRKIEFIKIPMADGGEGTVEAIIAGMGGQIRYTNVLNPLGQEIRSFFGILPNYTAVIEMAAASGLNLIGDQERNPLLTTTYGTGQLILAGLDAGCKKIIIGIGGSATNDGGVGMAQALGIKFLDQENRSIGFGGGELSKIQKIDISGIDPRIQNTTFIVASDVKNVLCGSDGATAVYGPQKGANQEMIAVLDSNLRHLADVIQKFLQKDIAHIAGSGAAGGLGGGLIAFLGARIQSGIQIVMELTHYAELVRQADLVITGEGCTDFQTMFGKVPFGVAQIAKSYSKPVICISGTLGDGYEKLSEIGITSFFSIINRPMVLDEAMRKGEELLEKLSENVFNLYFCYEMMKKVDESH
jgi:glycerate kinase